MEELKKKIEAINDYTDQRTIQDIKKKIEWFNLNDPEQKTIIDLFNKKLNN